MQTALLGDYDTATMLGVVRETKRPKSFLRDRFFGNNLNPTPTEMVKLDFVRDDRAMAPIVSRESEGKLVEKSPIVTGLYTPPMLAPLGIFTGRDAFMRSAGEPAEGSMSAEERAAKYAAQELLRHERLIWRRIEYFISQLLTTGTIVLEGVGVKDTIDIGHTLTDTLSAGSKWDQSTATIRKDVRHWVEDIAQECGITPDTCLCGRDVADAIFDNDAVQKALDVRNQNVGRIEPSETANGAIFMGNLEGVDFFSYPEWYKHDETGVSTPMIPTNMAILGCSANKAPENQIAFGAHYEVDEDRLYQEVLVPRVWTEKKNNTRFLEVVSYPVPIIGNVGSWMRIQVL